MATIETLIGRIQSWLLDQEAHLWSRDQVKSALLQEIGWLARKELFGEIRWVAGVASQAEYALPDETVRLAAVLYDGTPLVKTTERGLDRVGPDWFALSDPVPRYYLTDDQAPKTVRLAPAPLIPGQISMTFPPPVYGVAESEVQNLLLFPFIEPQGLLREESQEVAVPEVLEAVVVFRAVAALLRSETEMQDLTKASFFSQLATLWLGQLGVA